MSYACELAANQVGVSALHEGACSDACAPMDAFGEGLCAAYFGVKWNGTACEGVGGCSCVGADCGRLFSSEAECMTAYAGCSGAPGGPCGGFPGYVCRPDEWCDFAEPHYCGGADELGTCRPRPSICPDVIDPACGCDGTLYNNACEANVSGFDTVDDPSGCGATPGAEDPKPRDSDEARGAALRKRKERRFRVNRRYRAARMREDRPSTTASVVAFARAVATLRGSRAPACDPLAKSLVHPALGALLRALDPLGSRPLDLGLRLASAGLVDHIALRTAAIDRALTELLAGGPRQLVILGAGLDARAYRLPGVEEAVVFEVDHPATQRFKRERARTATPRARAALGVRRLRARAARGPARRRGPRRERAHGVALGRRAPLPRAGGDPRHARADPRAVRARELAGRDLRAERTISPGWGSRARCTSPSACSASPCGA
ncbi:MAG: class I SAM-dependent methyltransferase [Sandaracinaceae bacterium]|nr:class I SAM-dependent methyltransferase [Sandaracinaceae bacterium]